MRLQEVTAFDFIPPLTTPLNTGGQWTQEGRVGAVVPRPSLSPGGDGHPHLHVGKVRLRAPVIRPQTRARTRHQGLLRQGPRPAPLLKGLWMMTTPQIFLPFLACHGDTCWLGPAQVVVTNRGGVRPCDSKGREGTPAGRVGRGRGCRGAGGEEEWGGPRSWAHPCLLSPLPVRPTP